MFSCESFALSSLLFCSGIQIIVCFSFSTSDEPPVCSAFHPPIRASRFGRQFFLFVRWQRTSNRLSSKWISTWWDAPIETKAAVFRGIVRVMESFRWVLVCELLGVLKVNLCVKNGVVFSFCLCLR